MSYSMIPLFSIFFVLLASPSYAHSGGYVDIEILSDNGNRFYVIPFKDMKKGKTHVIKKYLEARRGENYSIAIRNRTGNRIGAVIAVDGRNIITGKKSFLKNDEQMYIIGPYSYSRLEGWRTDQDTVHRFYFTDKSDSYAERTFKDSSAMGVIAIAVFREKEIPKIQYKGKAGKENVPGAVPEPSKEGSMRSHENDIAGTGFGDQEYSPVVKVQFEPESIPYEKILVKYEWRQVLCRKRLLKCQPEKSVRLWDEGEYAPYPPGYADN